MSESIIIYCIRIVG